MLEWILIILAVAAIFYAGDLPKLKVYLEEKSKKAIEKAKEKRDEIEAKMNKDKKDNSDNNSDSQA